MLRSFLFSIATAGLAMSAPLITMSSLPAEAVAQTPAAEPTSPANDCFSVYPFGQVTIEATSPARGASFGPGDIVPIAGLIKNDSHASLPGASVFVRFLRDDVSVAEEHWHPIVAEFSIPNIALPAATEARAGEQSFAGEWHIPAFAPPGAYRVELSLLAADGSPIVGVPYVANVFGATSTFTITDAGHSAAVAWERNHVLFNNAPFSFRAVPPRPEAGPLTVMAPLQAGGAVPVSVNVEKMLYQWTDLEGDTLITSTTEELVIAPGETVPVSFTWEAPTPGVYELVLRATPLEAQVLPSIIRVRFYYEGTVPRILHAGMREEADGSGTVAACFFNSTFGPTGGSGVVRVTQDGSTIEEQTLADIAAKSVSTLAVPASVIKHGFTLVAEARDLTGNVTDTESVTFPAYPPEQSAFHFSGLEKPMTWWILGGGVVVLFGLLIAGITQRRRRRLITEPL